MIEKNLLISFIAILAGLGVSDLILSLHRLLRIRNQITWHWLPIVQAIISFQVMIVFWYNISSDLNSPLIKTSLGFLFWLLPLICVLLIMLAVLPDKTPKVNFNLYDWYIKNRKYYFTLYILLIITTIVNRLFQYETKEGWYIPVILLFVFSALLVSKKRWVHALGTILLFLFITAINFFLQTKGYV